MFFDEYFCLAGGMVMIGMAASILAIESWRARSQAPRWQTCLALTMLAWGPILLGAGILVVADEQLH
jgi:hypothetical protein